MKVTIEEGITLNKEELKKDYKKTLKKYNIKYEEIKEFIFIKKQKISLKKKNIKIFFKEI